MWVCRLLRLQLEGLLLVLLDLVMLLYNCRWMLVLFIVSVNCKVFGWLCLRVLVRVLLSICCRFMQCWGVSLIWLVLLGSVIVVSGLFLGRCLMLLLSQFLSSLCRLCWWFGFSVWMVWCRDDMVLCVSWVWWGFGVFWIRVSRWLFMLL